MSGEHHSVTDPCGSFGPDQRWAVVWFFCILFIGIGAVRLLRDTDNYNYKTNGEFYDYSKYRSNTVSKSHIPSEVSDDRMHGGYGDAVKKLGS